MYSGRHLISAFMFTRILGHLDKKDLQYLFFVHIKLWYINPNPDGFGHI
jgi:hypothetical protein